MFVDDYSKFTWLFPISQKYEVVDVFLHFQKFVDINLICKFKSHQSDWGGEYPKISTYFHQCGIAHQIACPYTHEQDDSAEHKICHVIEKGLSVLAHASTPHRFWHLLKQWYFLSIAYLPLFLKTNLYLRFCLKLSLTINSLKFLDVQHTRLIVLTINITHIMLF